MTTFPHKGSSTIEILIAFAILMLSLTAVIVVFFGNQSVTVDTEQSNEGLGLAEQSLTDAQALAAKNFLAASSSVTTETSGGLTFTKTLTVADLTPCRKQATSTISWTASPLRAQKIELSTVLTDLAGALLLGGDCFLLPPTGGWTNPTRFASDTFSPGKSTALDVLNRIVYMGEDKAPYFAIADTRSATLGQNSGLFVTFTNGFTLGKQINALDAISWTNPSTGAKKVYVFAAINDATNQLAVIDATTPTAPVLISTHTVCATGSNPEGWFVTAYGNRLYLVARETANKELHVFNITTPGSTSELPIGGSLCAGYELNSTAEEMVVRDQVVNGTTKRYVYLATDQNNREVRVLDVTDPYAIQETTGVDMAGNTDTASISMTGSRVYVGRLNDNSGSELFVYDAYNPPAGLTLLGSKDIGASVFGVRVAGQFGFLATSKTSQEFQVWNVSTPSVITNIAKFNFGNIVSRGLDYEPDYIYATGQSTPNFQILYSP